MLLLCIRRPSENTANYPEPIVGEEYSPIESIIAKELYGRHGFRVSQEEDTLFYKFSELGAGNLWYHESLFAAFPSLEEEQSQTEAYDNRTTVPQRVGII